MTKNILTTLSFLLINLIIFGSSYPVIEIPFKEFKDSFDELDAKDFNNFTDLSWVNKDENDTQLLNLPINQTFNISDQVRLYLYVNQYPNTPFSLNLANSKEAPMNINHPTKILIHGWKSEWNNSVWSIPTKNSIIKADNSNVIIVDYGKYAYLDFAYAVIKARKVGAYIAQVILDLYKHNKTILENIHIIGFSLGAHVCGYAGKTIKAQCNKTIGRITGLDPGGPVFDELEAEKRLDKDDALFTDVIHTSGGFLGYRQSLGHVDFFPNGGVPVQPGCGNESTPFHCSHLTAGEYYNRSILSKKFLAMPCSSWENFRQGKCNSCSELVSMGYHVNPLARGDYYLTILDN